MLSRDPTGLDPSGVDDSVRLEPAGSRAEESVEHFLMSPTNVLNMHHEGAFGQQKSLDALDVALLIGAPPPPPKTPPPKKIKRRTPRHQHSKAGVTPKITNVASFTSIDEDSLLQSLAASSPKSFEHKSFEPDSPTDNGEKTLHTRNTSGSMSPDSVKVDIPPEQHSEDVRPDSVIVNIVEERLKAARALYEREELVLDDNDDMNREILRPAMAIIDNKLEMLLALPSIHESPLQKDNAGKPDVTVDMATVTSPKPHTLVLPSPSSEVTKQQQSEPSPMSQKRVPPSPSSEVTRPHSNKAPEMKHFVSGVTSLSNISESPRGTISPRETERPEQEHLERQRRALSAERHEKKVTEDKGKRDQKRGFFKKLFRGRTKSRGDLPKSRDSSPVIPASPRSRVSPRSRSSPRSMSSPRSRSKSSPRRMASPRSRSKSASRQSPSPKAKSVASSPRSNASPRKPRDSGFDQRATAENPSSPATSSSARYRQRPQLKPALKSEVERQYQGPAMDAQLEEHVDLISENPAELPPTPAANRSVSTPLSRTETTEPSAFSYSQDPPDDEHGDPPEFSGRPLISPTSYNARAITPQHQDEVARIESVKSRIAELYEEQNHIEEEGPDDERPITQVPSSLSHDRNDYFFAQDEVSALTGTFGSKSFDPSGSDSQEEVIIEQSPSSSQDLAPDDKHKQVDPYMASFVNSTEALPSTPAHTANLRVHVPGPSQDPAGASPLKWSYRGHPLMHTGFRDPVGESPMHSLKKLNPQPDLNDPTLICDDNNHLSVNEEKKDDDIETEISPTISSSSNSETPFEKDFLLDQAEKSANETSSKANRSVTVLKLAQITGLDAIPESLNLARTSRAPMETSKKGDSTAAHHRQNIMKVETGSAINLKTKKSRRSVPPSNNVENMKEFTLRTDVEKVGFKSASSTPVAGQKALTITTAAFTNAKAVAYLHRLHGEPSPRHTWHASKRTQSDISPLARKANARKASGKKKSLVAPGSHKKPSPDEYGAHNFDESLIGSENTSTNKVVYARPEELHVVKTKEGALFSAYNAKFQGRKPSKKTVPKVETPTGNRLSLSSRGRHDFEPQGESKPSCLHVEIKPGKITGWAVAKGIQLRRSKRDDDVANGKSARVVITPKRKTEGRNRFKFVPQNEDEIKDPIQRAGRRILSKSAIPIQCAVRRYIARREAIDRMWALIEIQSYCRRWRAEANLQASIHSAVQMQRSFRGWLAREQLKDMTCAATQIQKIVRGYLCQAKVYDTIYYIVRIQALFKGCYERKIQQKKKIAAIEIQKYLRGFQTRLQVWKNMQAIPIQSAYRGHMARQEYAIALASVKLIQSNWRAYSARIAFQFEIVDIIIVQSIFRRWAGCRYAKALRDNARYGPASIIQAAWRGHTTYRDYKKIVSARTIQTVWRGFLCHNEYKRTIAARSIQKVWRGRLCNREYKRTIAARKIQTCWRGFQCHTAYKKNIAARTIQTLWRGFQCYTDYIFALVDILVVQRTARQWLAKRRANQIRKENAAIRVQACWRRHKAKSTLLFSLVHIIIAQSVARRYLARFIVRKRRLEIKALHDAEQQKTHAATAIQKIWRGFLGFSHYIIMQYEISRLQAIVRGKLARQSYNLKLGCAIIIQANIRRHLAKNAIGKKMVSDAMTESAALSLREGNAAKRIQFWWRIVLDWTKEKKAALTIERFFIRVREEVDREIMRRERRKMMKKEKRRQKRRESDEQMLERAWLNTVDENTAVGNYSRDSVTETDSRSKSAPRLREGSQAIVQDVPHRTPALGMSNRLLSPKLSNVGQEVDIHGWPIQRVDSSSSRTRPPTDSVRMSSSEDYSEVSNITNPTIFNRMGQPPGRYEGQPRPSRDKRMSTDDYIKKYGNDNGSQTAPNRLISGGQPHHFFSDNGSVGSNKNEKTISTGLPNAIPPHPQVQVQVLNVAGTPTAKRRSSSTPRSQASTPRGFSKSNTHGTRNIPSSTTPRNNSSVMVAMPTTPRNTASTHQVPSPRIQVGFPPATPRSHKSGNKMHISRRETAETESQTTYSQNSFSKASPHSRSDGNVNVMKSYQTFLKSHSVDDGQEVLYYGGADFGDEYGEV